MSEISCKFCQSYTMISGHSASITSSMKEDYNLTENIDRYTIFLCQLCGKSTTYLRDITDITKPFFIRLGYRYDESDAI